MKMKYDCGVCWFVGSSHTAMNTKGYNTSTAPDPDCRFNLNTRDVKSVNLRVTRKAMDRYYSPRLSHQYKCYSDVEYFGLQAAHY